MNEVAKDVNKTNDDIIQEPTYDSKYFKYFSFWMKSEHCVHSRKQVLNNIKELYKLLDDEAELALQPGYFLKYKQ